MYRKVKKVSFILIWVLSSCNQSYFQKLTHNDVGYWRYEGCRSPIREYSRKDSTFEYYNKNLIHEFSGWTWLEMCEHKFRVSNDTIYHFVRSKETGRSYPEYTYKIVSLNKNKLRTLYILNEKEKADPNIPNPDTFTLFRIKTKDVKRIKKGKTVKFKDCIYEEEANPDTIFRIKTKDVKKLKKWKKVKKVKFKDYIEYEKDNLHVNINLFMSGMYRL